MWSAVGLLFWFHTLGLHRFVVFDPKVPALVRCRSLADIGFVVTVVRQIGAGFLGVFGVWVTGVFRFGLRPRDGCCIVGRN